MKNSTIRLVVVLGTLCIIGITITQIYWVKRAFDLKEAEFNRTVNTALYNVAQEIYQIKQTPSPAVNPVRQISTNYFVVLVNNELEAGLLEFLLKSEFQKRHIVADFEYGIYDCTNQCMIYGDYVPLQTQKNLTTAKVLPEWANTGYHFGVQFPNREAQLINQMGIWSFSSLVLLIVIIFFCYTLFIILKQKRLSEIQKDFINNMTHEFKTPISTIALATRVLQDPQIQVQPERLLKYATIIENENVRLKNHVERVLQLAKMDKENLSLKLERVSLRAVLEDAFNCARMTLQERKGNLVINMDRDRTLTADRHHITNALHNLIDNAIKYTHQTPQIEVEVNGNDRTIAIHVKDNGIGISDADQKKIFQKFYRIPTGNLHDVKGFGLGLSYVKSIISAHGGNITLRSEPNQGSTFSVYLPITA